MYGTRLLQASSESSARSGNVLVFALLIMTLLAALATAQFAVVHRNAQASTYYLAYSDLHKYAENGIGMSVHDLTYNVTGQGGKIGTAYWNSSYDFGRDGLAATHDEGEGDGLPTLGEPTVYPMHLGSYGANLGLIVSVTPSPFADVFRVVSTSVSSEGTSTVETFVRKVIATLPRVGAVYVDPTIALDLKGGRFMIDGRDHNPDGTTNANPPLYGISTDAASTAGTNQALLLSQISSKYYTQIIGVGASPSVGEVPKVDLTGLFEAFKGAKTQELAPATYTTGDFGNYGTDDFRVTYVGGDLHLSGNAQGAGVLLVDGTLRVTGQFKFHGLVIVRGDIVLSGGGAEIHTLGSVMVGNSITAIDYTELTVSGTADLFYSSVVLNRIELMLQPRYNVVYYDEK